MSDSKLTQPQQARSAWRRLVDDQVARIDHAFVQAASLEGQRLEHLKATLTDITSLSRDTFAYWSQLNAEWRKLSLDVTRRAVDRITIRE